MKKFSNSADKGCDNCYYECFDEKAYPCSLCIRGVERKDMWVAKGKYSINPVWLKQRLETEIPSSCVNCPNHPSNGGSGICHCTLGNPTVTVTL